MEMKCDCRAVETEFLNYVLLYPAVYFSSPPFFTLASLRNVLAAFARKVGER
jgi:hypothetical protein